MIENKVPRGFSFGLVLHLICFSFASQLLRICSQVLFATSLLYTFVKVNFLALLPMWTHTAGPWSARVTLSGVKYTLEFVGKRIIQKQFVLFCDAIRSVCLFLVAHAHSKLYF